MPRVQLLGSNVSTRGEAVLRRRDTEDAGPVYELIVNGVLAMDSRETTSERDACTTGPTS